MASPTEPPKPDTPTGIPLFGLEGRYQVLFRNGLQGIVVQDAGGRIISANPAAERILGLSLDQLLGRTSTDPRWHAIREDGSDFPGTAHPAMVALATGEPQEGVLMGLSHPERGDIRWISVNAAPMFLPGGPGPYQVLTTFLDVTARHRTEEVLGFLDEAGWVAAGEDFFRAALRFLAQRLGLDHGLAAELPEGLPALRTLALWPGGAASAGQEVPLAGSPFEAPAGTPVWAFPEGVRQRFPDCRLLQEFEAESCLGALLRSTRNRPIGLLALFSRKPLADSALAAAILRVVGLRAAAELELRQA